MVVILRWCRAWICLLYPILSSNSTIQYTSTIISIKPYNIIDTNNTDNNNNGVCKNTTTTAEFNIDISIFSIGM